MKSILIPKLNYFLNIPNPCDFVLKKIECLLFSFVWSGHDLIKRSQLCQTYEGRVKIINVWEFIHSLCFSSVLNGVFKFFLRDSVEFLNEGESDY